MRLRYTRPALADLTAILDIIAAHSPQGARRVQVGHDVRTVSEMGWTAYANE